MCVRERKCVRERERESKCECECVREGNREEESVSELKRDRREK